jgi:hypothetical protein
MLLSNDWMLPTLNNTRPKEQSKKVSFSLQGLLPMAKEI